MGIQEYARRWVEDADIIIDFQKKQVTFKNEKKAFRNIKGLAVELVAPAVLLFAFFSLLGIFCSLAIAGGWVCLYFYQTLGMNFQPLRSLYFKMRRHPMARVTIANPEGTVTYETRSGMPFFDLEFSRSVGKRLQTVSLLKNSRKTSLLKVEILGKASGDLVIKEF